MGQDFLTGKKFSYLTWVLDKATSLFVSHQQKRGRFSNPNSNRHSHVVGLNFDQINQRQICAFWHLLNLVEQHNKF